MIIGKLIKRIIKALISLLLVAVIVVLGIFFFYYPHYKLNQKELQIENIAEKGELRVMSSNVRCINEHDLFKKSWFYRADLIVRNIENNAPTIIGFQEVSKYHYKYLTETLTQFDSVTEYRDDSALPESCPIFYRSDLYRLIDKGAFWLSETPDKMSISWGAACYRICSYVILEDNATGSQFVVFNLHLDHVSEEARVNGIGVVLDKIKEFGSLPAIIMGDLNAEEDSVTYKNVTENFLDAKYQIEDPMKGPTYHNYGNEENFESIDYFLISKEGFEVESYKIVTDTYNGVYPSDHYPIFTVLELEG